jgi:hypothetical protein
MPQPNLVPVKFISSRSTHSKGTLVSALEVLFLTVDIQIH